MKIYEPVDATSKAYVALVAHFTDEQTDGWTVKLCDRMPPLSDMPANTYLGSFGYTDTVNKVRYLLNQHAVNLAGTDIITTPSAIARAYVGGLIGKKKLRMKTRQWQEHVRGRKSPPLYAVPSSGDGVYVDLRGAYWQVVSTVGWLPDYSRGRYLGREYPVTDFPFPHEKLARNMLVSIGLGGTSSVWTGERIVQRKTRNKFTNLMLWSVAMDFLHNAAFLALVSGAVYVHTDGYIFRGHDYMRFVDTLDSAGILWDIKHRGNFVVRGVGDYDIGARVSKRPHAIGAREFDTIIPASSQWFFDRWAKLTTMHW